VSHPPNICHKTVTIQLSVALCPATTLSLLGRAGLAHIFSFLKGLLAPVIGRPPRFQVAALCHREKDGHRQILLITSRDTGRWILPKGWPIAGKDAAGSALQEAWEEAGVHPKPGAPVELGRYFYDKIMDGGVPVPCETKVFAIAVADLADVFPEKSQRRRKWVSPDDAADMVNEPSLKALLRDLPAQFHA